MLLPSAGLRHTKKLDSEPRLPGAAFDGSRHEPRGQSRRGLAEALMFFLEAHHNLGTMGSRDKAKARVRRGACACHTLHNMRVVFFSPRLPCALQTPVTSPLQTRVTSVKKKPEEQTRRSH